MDNYCCQNYKTTLGAHYCKLLGRFKAYFGTKTDLFNFILIFVSNFDETQHKIIKEHPAYKY